MRKLAILLLVLMFAGCAGEEIPAEAEEIRAADVVITDRFFSQQMHEILLNPSRYIGQTIQFEGEFMSLEWEGEYFFAVAQNVPSCCSPDGMLGIEVQMDESERFEEGAWVEVIGVLEQSVEGFLSLADIDIGETTPPPAEPS